MSICEGLNDGAVFDGVDKEVKLVLRAERGISAEVAVENEERDGIRGR